MNKMAETKNQAVATTKWEEEYKEFEQIVERLGILNINAAIVAEQLGVPYQTVVSWRKKYISTIDFNIEELGKKINHQGARILERIALHVNNDDPRISVIAGKTFIETAHKYVETLEKVGVIKRDESELPSGPNIIDEEAAYDILTKTQKEKLVLMLGGTLPEKPGKKRTGLKKGGVTAKNKPRKKKKEKKKNG